MSKLWVSKCWRRLEDRLKNRNRLYYVGATLFVDTLCENQEVISIGLNLNGKGFVFGSPFIKNGTVYLPEHILELVQQIYKEEKDSIVCD